MVSTRSKAYLSPKKRIMNANIANIYWMDTNNRSSPPISGISAKAIPCDILKMLIT